MASKASTSSALLLLLNILFFTMVSSTYSPACDCSPKTPKTPSTPKTPTPKTPSSPKTPSPKTPSTPKTPTPSTPKTPSPTTPSTPKTPSPKTPSTPKTPSPKTPSPKTPSTPKSPSTGHNAKCPIDTLKLGVCANLLNDLVHLIVGTPSNTQCCSLIGGLADLDAAVCLCTAIKANVLGINLNVPVSLSLLLNYCGKKSPSGFHCK